MSQVLILGGGFGGISAALTLRALLPATDKIILADRKTHFMMGFRKTWGLLDIAPLKEGMRPLAALSKRGIVVCQANIEKIEPETCSAILDGECVTADALVVALGVRSAPEKIPGFNQHALNAYALPHEMEPIKQRLRQFTGGKIIMGTFGLPHQCPPAPYEGAILTKEYFDQRHIAVDIIVLSPKPFSLMSAGEDASHRLEQRMAEFGIQFLPNHKVLSVEADAVFTDQGRLQCDLAFGVPPNVAVDVVRQSPLVAVDGWIHPNLHTLETEFKNVYAIGDCTVIPVNKIGQLPQAGLIAEKEGEVVAKRIAARLTGHEPTAVLDGQAACTFETGRHEGALLGGDFLATPQPDIRLSEIGPEHYASKHEFETSRLEKWFG